MKELSLNILDITENSVKAGAKHISISIEEIGSRFSLCIADDGCGMEPEVVERVANPFYTTRTTRPVGMGISLLKLAAEQTGGGLTIESTCEKHSPDKHGTTLCAVFDSSHIDFEPLGDICSTLITLIQGSPDIDFCFSHSTSKGAVQLDTAQLREVLGDVSLASFEVLQWIEAYLKEQYEAIQ